MKYFIKPYLRSLLLTELQELEKEKWLTGKQVEETIHQVNNSWPIDSVVLEKLISSLEGQIEIFEDDHDTEELENLEEYQLTEELFALLVQMEEESQ